MNICECLTPREQEVLAGVVLGKMNKEIATSLGIRTGTVHKHVANLMGKMGARSRTDAAVKGVVAGLTELVHDAGEKVGA